MLDQIGLRQEVHSLINLLVSARYSELLQLCVRSRLTTEDIESVISGYFAVPTLPPNNYPNDHIDIIPIKRTQGRSFAIEAPLWTEEEGESDLVLTLTATIRGNQYVFELDDLHVL